MVGAGLLWGQFLHIQPTQTVFISTCLSLSSTPLVSRFLAGGGKVDKEGICRRAFLVAFFMINVSFVFYKRK